ncbi:hypothetical protein C8R43DRAFT_961002 [Mycena crocata]|nr:hypothetical protein C8R43DRAFT_961002 [Mycena crocata]
MPATRPKSSPSRHAPSYVPAYAIHQTLVSMPSLRNPSLSPTVRRQYQAMKKQQRTAGNLTTVDHTGGFMVMSLFPYPVNEEGSPIVPTEVHDHLKARIAPLPICFCKELARFKRVVLTGEHGGKAAYMCGLGHECPFWFCPDDILYGTPKENNPQSDNVISMQLRNPFILQFPNLRAFRLRITIHLHGIQQHRDMSHPVTQAVAHPSELWCLREQPTFDLRSCLSFRTPSDFRTVRTSAGLTVLPLAQYITDNNIGIIRYVNYSLLGQTNIPADIYITPCELTSGKRAPRSVQGAIAGSSTSISGSSTSIASTSTSLTSTPSLNSGYSSSEFSWSPIRNLLNMCGASDSPIKSDPFTGANRSAGNLLPRIKRELADAAAEIFSPQTEHHVMQALLPVLEVQVKQEESSVVGSDSSISPDGVGPIFGANHGSLPLPTFPLSGDHRLELWTPPPLSALVNKPSSKVPVSAADPPVPIWALRRPLLIQYQSHFLVVCDMVSFRKKLESTSSQDLSASYHTRVSLSATRVPPTYFLALWASSAVKQSAAVRQASSLKRLRVMDFLKYVV